MNTSKRRVLRPTIREPLHGVKGMIALLKQQIPDVQVPGFTEMDLVSHSGSSASAEFCQSLNLIDIHTTGTEARSVLGKGQHGVPRAQEEMRSGLPFPWAGIDSDKGAEFINDHL